MQDFRWYIITKFPFRFMKKMKKTWPIFAAVVLIDVDPRLDLIDLIDLDDLRWVLASNYRPFRPTRSTSRVIAENRFFNLFLFSGDGRPVYFGSRFVSTIRPPHHFVTTAATGMYLCVKLKTPPFGRKFKSLINDLSVVFENVVHNWSGRYI